MTERGERGGPIRRLLATPDFVRLWAAGGLTNSMRWVEMLVSGVFAFQLTGSALAVSLVLMVRAVPMMLGGALTGAIAECLDRRRLLLTGQALQAAGAVVVALLAASGALALWHLALNGLLGGVVWTNELSTRRRMVAEAAPPQDVISAVALDTMTGSTTRMVGPLLGGLLFQTLGVAAAYGIASVLYLLAFGLVFRVQHTQRRQALVPRRLLAEVGEAARVAGRSPVLVAVLGVTFVMNVFAFSYASVLPAFGAEVFGASPFQVGLLTAAEPAGALLAGLAIALRRGLGTGAAALVTGSAFFLCLMIAAAFAPTLWVAAGLLLLGGLGTAAFASLQTGLVILHAPIEARSRILGLITTCIGMSPFGVLAIGALADAIGPARAIAVMGGCGLLGLGVVGWWLHRGRATPDGGRPLTDA